MADKAYLSLGCSRLQNTLSKVQPGLQKPRLSLISLPKANWPTWCKFILSQVVRAAHCLMQVGLPLHVGRRPALFVYKLPFPASEDDLGARHWLGIAGYCVHCSRSLSALPALLLVVSRCDCCRSRTLDKPASRHAAAQTGSPASLPNKKSLLLAYRSQLHQPAWCSCRAQTCKKWRDTRLQSRDELAADHRDKVHRRQVHLPP